jgi:hypothetical protein
MPQAPHASASPGPNGSLENARGKSDFGHAKRRFINLDSQDLFMELDQKIRYGLAAATAASIALSAFGLHVSALEIAGRVG